MVLEKTPKKSRAQLEATWQRRVKKQRVLHYPRIRKLFNTRPIMSRVELTEQYTFVYGTAPFPAAIHTALNKLKREGFIVRHGYGLYRVTGYTPTDSELREYKRKRAAKISNGFKRRAKKLLEKKLAPPTPAEKDMVLAWLIGYAIRAHAANSDHPNFTAGIPVFPGIRMWVVINPFIYFFKFFFRK